MKVGSISMKQTHL